MDRVCSQGVILRCKYLRTRPLALTRVPTPQYLYVVGEWGVVTLLGFALAVVSRVAAPGGGEVKKVA